MLAIRVNETKFFHEPKTDANAMIMANIRTPDKSEIQIIFFFRKEFCFLRAVSKHSVPSTTLSAAPETLASILSIVSP